MPEDILSIVSMLLTVIAVLLMAYFFTRYIAGRSPGGMRTQGGKKQLRVIEQVSLGREQRVAVVQVGERYFVLGITSSNVNKLAELTEEERTLWQMESSAGGGMGSSNPNFRDSLLKVLEKKKK